MPLIPAPPIPMRCTRSPSTGALIAGVARSGVIAGVAHATGPTGAPTSSSTMRASRSSASACPDARAALPRRRQPGRVAQQRHELGQHPVAGQLGVGTSAPPPAATTGSALSACSPLPCGSGTYTAGSPTAETSATVIAPGPAQHERRRRRRPGACPRCTGAAR